jgi:hypothetical protein
VILTFVAGLQYQIPVINDFSATGGPFLMSLVALGKKSCEIFFNILILILAGFSNVMPLLFGRVQHTRNGVILFQCLNKLFC